jgi:uncharacterized protein
MKCPICHKTTQPECAPFCSKNCKNIDLIRWLKEDYRVPTNEIPTDGIEGADERDEDK